MGRGLGFRNRASGLGFIYVEQLSAVVSPVVSYRLILHCILAPSSNSLDTQSRPGVYLEGQGT